MAPNSNDGGPRPAVVAALEHLTGVSRGETDWVVEERTLVRIDPQGELALITASDADAASDTDADAVTEDVIAALLHRDGGFVVEPAGGQSVWINGDRVNTARRALAHNDVVEFGEAGPISRVSLYQQGGRPHHTAAAILSDTLAYMRVSRRPLPSRLARAAGAVVRRLARETSLLFRMAVILAIVALVVVIDRQAARNAELEQVVASSAARLEAFSAALARAREDALTPADLTAISRDFSQRLTTASGRLAALEARSQATANAIAAALPSVAFLQGAYGFRQRGSGSMLRHVTDDDGKPMTAPNGQPMLMLGGPGPVAERQYTGTGFALADPAVIVTNRHVALPWEKDASADALREQGIDPVMLRLAAYFPDVAMAVDMTLAKASDKGDLAVLLPTEGGATPITAVGLRLADAPPRRGAEVIVMGYPTGLRALLAQTGEAFVEDLRADEATEFWTVAERLATAGYIAPLASRGIVAQTTSAALVYDAETTHGGSGGPVLNANGAVVAVNAAILPEYGGSNLGVPAALLRELLGSL